MGAASDAATGTSAKQLAQRLFDAFESGRPVAPLTDADPGLDVDGAYAVQRELVRLHEQRGRRRIGRKVGLTSLAMQRQLGVDQPDFGVLYDSHVFESGAELSPGGQRMIAPRIEAELGFLLGEELRGPGVRVEDVLRATRAIVPSYELIDSRIEKWKIKLPDTIADNASSFGVVRGAGVEPPGASSLPTVGLVLEHDGEVRATAAGAAVLDDPAEAVAWLANTLAGWDESLHEGELVLSGSFTAAFELEPGRWRARFGEGIGDVELEIEEA